MQWLCAKKKGKSDKIYKRPLEIELDKYPVLGDFCSIFFLARRYSVIFKCISVFDQFFLRKVSLAQDSLKNVHQPLLGMGLWAIIVYAKNVESFFLSRTQPPLQVQKTPLMDNQRIITIATIFIVYF